MAQWMGNIFKEIQEWDEENLTKSNAHESVFIISKHLRHFRGQQGFSEKQRDFPV